MAKQDPHKREAIPLSDMRLYRVSLIVAVPDYGLSTSALDAIVPSLESEIALLSMEETELMVVPTEPMAVAQAPAVPAVKADNTVPVDIDSVDALLGYDSTAQVAQPTKRKKSKSKKSKRKSRRNPEVLARIETVFKTVEAVGSASADEIALLSGVRVKLVYADLYDLHNAKRIAAHKEHGKVQWMRLGYTAPTTTESK